MTDAGSRNDEGNIKIGIIGLSRTGKSTYLASSWRKIRANTQAPLKMHFLGESLKYLTDIEDGIDMGSFPETTMFDQKEFTIEVYRRPKYIRGLLQGLDIEKKVTFKDFPGEIFDFTTDKVGDRIEAFKYLQNCQGLLFLIDPTHHWTLLNQEGKSRYSTIICNILENLRSVGNNNTRKTMIIAFVITKIDTLILDDYGVFNKIRNITRPGYREDIQNILQTFASTSIFADNDSTIGTINNFSSPRFKIKTEWFACSSIGWFEIRKLEFENMDNDFKEFYSDKLEFPGISSQKGKYLLPRTYQSGEKFKIYQPQLREGFGLEAPFEWLIEEILISHR